MPESKRRKLRTVGDLRAVLSEAIEAVMSGELDPHKATAVTKLASQINASLLAEIEVARFQLSQTNTLPALGSLALAPDDLAPSAPPTIEAYAEPAAADRIVPSPKAFALADAAEAMRSAKSRQGALAPRVIDHRHSGVVDIPGMPEPGRSALDQRRAV